MPENFSVTFERNVAVPMRDGTVLYADVFRPAGEGRYPVLLQRTPYQKDSPVVTGIMGDPLRFAGNGYVVVIQDTRGRYNSEGEFCVFRDDVQDGYDTVEWCAEQQWSTGKVGMYGASYVGATQWLAAISRPPHLVTILPVVTPSDYHNGWTYQGGAFELGFNLSWTLLFFAPDTALRAITAEGQGAERLAAIVTAIDALPEEFRRLPLKDQPALDGVADYYADWLAHPDEDDYWRAWKIEDHHDELDIPVFNIGGWYDIFLGGTIQNFTGMREHAATPEARRGQKLLIGPWFHGIPWLANPVGQVDFGLASAGAAFDLEGMQIRWFDHWLKGEETGILDEPPVRIFVMGANEWRDEQEWPLARTQFTDYFFHSAGRANSLDGDGSLSTTPPVDEPPDNYLYNPRDPVPTLGGGLCCSPSHTQGGAFDQRCIESRPDVLVYTTPALQDDLEVTGPVTVRLWASTSARDTDWTAKLVDVGPDGFARNLTDGILRARYRGSLTSPQLLEAGQIYEYEIDLWATSNVFRAGHRVRVEISSSNFPRFDRNLNTGGTQADEATIETALQRVYHDTKRPSRVVLPVIAAASPVQEPDVPATSDETVPFPA